MRVGQPSPATYGPPTRKLVEQPFWLDPSDSHRMRAATQMPTRTHQYNGLGVRENEWRSTRIFNAVHRVVVEGISPERRSTSRSPESSRS